MSGTAPKKPSQTVTVTVVGRRLTRRTQTKATDECGLDHYTETLDQEATLNLRRIKAGAIAVLNAAGVEAYPIEFALERVLCERRKDDSRDDDSLVGLAAQSLCHIHQLELFEAYYGKPQDRPMHHAYSLGRLAILMRERMETTKQTKAAAVLRVPGTIDTKHEGKVTKELLVGRAIDAAGAGAGTLAVWTHLIGVLDQEGLNPRETGAKDKRRIECDDADFTFGSVKSMVSRIKTAAGRTTTRGRPKGK